MQKENIISTMRAIFLVTSELPVLYTNNVVIFYVIWFWRILYMYYSIIIINFISNEFAHAYPL